MLNETKLKKWKLISKEDVSPSKWYPIEKRKYILPDGKKIDDFFVTTLPDVVRIIPVTKDNKIVMVRQFKAGADKITIEFPAGRFENKKDLSLKEYAQLELEEETGIKVDVNALEPLGEYYTASTKATTVDYTYVVFNVEFNTVQKCDENEDIEVILLSIKEIEDLIKEGKICDASVFSDMYLFKLKYKDLME